MFFDLFWKFSLFNIFFFQHSYFGRNLIVQGMYFGKQRYWLFSLVMSDSCIQKVQAEADILWWSKTPDLSVEQEKRFRRFVAKKTAVGKRNQGGLGNMDWASHVKAFQAQWIIRYAADPAASSWKSSRVAKSDPWSTQWRGGSSTYAQHKVHKIHPPEAAKKIGL